MRVTTVVYYSIVVRAKIVQFWQKSPVVGEISIESPAYESLNVPAYITLFEWRLLSVWFFTFSRLIDMLVVGFLWKSKTTGFFRCCDLGWRERSREREREWEREREKKKKKETRQRRKESRTPIRLSRWHSLSPLLPQMTLDEWLQSSTIFVFNRCFALWQQPCLAESLPLYGNRPSSDAACLPRYSTTKQSCVLLLCVSRRFNPIEFTNDLTAYTRENVCAYFPRGGDFQNEYSPRCSLFRSALCSTGQSKFGDKVF